MSAHTQLERWTSVSARSDSVRSLLSTVKRDARDALLSVPSTATNAWHSVISPDGTLPALLCSHFFQYLSVPSGVI